MQILGKMSKAILSYRNFNKFQMKGISAFGRNSDSPYRSGKRLDQIGRFRYDPALCQKGCAKQDSARGVSRVPIWSLFCLLLFFQIVFAQDISALKADIYSKIGCITCKDMSIDKCHCPQSREMKAYIEALLETAVSREEIFYKVAKKYSLNAIMDIKIRREVEERLIKEAGDKRPQIALDSSFFDFGGVTKKQGKISKIFKLTNKGNALLIIRSLKTSCPCASVALKIDKNQTPYFGTEGSPKDWRAEIKPEETAELEVIVDLASPHVNPGKLIRDARIISNDPLYPETTVRVGAEVLE